MLDEWAYAKPYGSETERVAAFTDWLHHYNRHRGHTSLKGQPPASRVGSVRSIHLGYAARWREVEAAPVADG
jgi:hypothetical protein